MKRLHEAQSMIAELLEADESALLACGQLDDYVDDIVKKLSHIRTSVASSSSAVHSPAPSWSSSSCASPAFGESTKSYLGVHHKSSSSSSDYLHRSSPLSPPPSSSASSTSSGSFWPTTDGIPSIASAQAAFDSQIYSRCVQIVEKLERSVGRKLDRTAIVLCHQSYMHMVEDAQTEEDAAKFAHYWVDFLDRVFDSHAPPITRMEQLDFRCEALDALFSLDENLREHTGRRRLIAGMDGYKVCLLVYRPFDLHTIRRLQRLARALNEGEAMVQDTEDFKEADAVYGKGLRQAWRDRVKYEEETKGTGTGRTDTDAVVATEILAALQHERPCTSLSRTTSAESDNIVEKVFVEDMIYRL